MKQVELLQDKFDKTWSVSVSINGVQWNTVFCGTKGDANVIIAAFEKIGYERSK